MTDVPRALVLLAPALVLAACNRSANVTAPTPLSTGGTSGGVQLAAVESGARDVAFPPRNEPFDFRQQLEAKYRDQLRRGPTSSFVDIEGDIVWVQEYLRYRVNLCDHGTAVQRVFMQIDGMGIQPVCGTASSGAVAFPPRTEPFDFRTRLEAKYRDQLRSQATTTFVDIEGDIVWVQEYLRYRVNNCNHSEAVQKVFMQIDGLGIQPVCGMAVTAPDARIRMLSLAGNTTTQCNVTRPTGLDNRLECIFDGSSSMGSISEYRWTFPGSVTRTGAVQQQVVVPCGSFGGGGGAANRDVTLRVSGPGGSDTDTISVTFTLATFC